MILKAIFKGRVLDFTIVYKSLFPIKNCIKTNRNYRGFYEQI